MDWNNFVDDMNVQLRELSKTIPETTKGFGALTKAAKEGGTLDAKNKEFVALGIAIAMRCEPCIGFHVTALHKPRATP